MEPPNPIFILKKSSEAIMDLCFWSNHHDACGNTSPRCHAFDQPMIYENFLIAGYSNSSGVDVWDLSTRRVKAHFPSRHGIISVAGTDDGEVIFLNREGELKMFDIDCSESKLNIQVPNVGFCKMSCFMEEHKLSCAVTGEPDSSICIWDLRKVSIISNLEPTKDAKLGMVMAVRLFKLGTPNAMYCLGAYESGHLLLWDVAKYTIMSKVELFKMEPIMCFDFAPQILSGIAGSPSETLNKFVLCNDELGQLHIKIKKSATMVNAGIADVKIRPDCKIFAAGGWHDGSVRIFSMKSLKALAVLDYHSGTVQSLAFKPDEESRNQVLASGSIMHKIAIWKIYND